MLGCQKAGTLFFLSKFMHSPLLSYTLKIARLALAQANAAASTIAALPTHTISAADPEGVVTAAPASTHFNTATETKWTKKTGTGNTGWV